MTIPDVPATAALDEALPVAVTAPSAGSAEPTRPVSGRFLTVYAVAYTAMWMALLAPAIVTLSLRVQELLGVSATGSLSLVMGVGALFALVGNPLFGRLSDRTTSRLGMRRPWLIGGAVGGLLASVVVALAPNLPVLLIGWCMLQLSYNALLAAMMAILPDQVPAEQRGRVSGIIGIGLPLGTVLGTLVVQLVSGNMLLMFGLPSAIALVAALGLAAVLAVVALLNARGRRRRPRAAPRARPGRPPRR
jgi:MFS family permease